jgi:hypothetical protein
VYYAIQDKIDEVQAVKGFYLTAINVHNPGVRAGDSLSFAKKVAIAFPVEHIPERRVNVTVDP